MFLTHLLSLNTKDCYLQDFEIINRAIFQHTSSYTYCFPNYYTLLNVHFNSCTLMTDSVSPVITILNTTSTYYYTNISQYSKSISYPPAPTHYSAFLLLCQNNTRKRKKSYCLFNWQNWSDNICNIWDGIECSLWYIGTNVSDQPVASIFSEDDRMQPAALNNSTYCLVFHVGTTLHHTTS